MEKLKRSVILSLIIATITLFVLAKGVLASGTVAMQTIPTGNNTTNAVVLSSNVAKDNQVPPANTLTPTNITNTTTVPQTGEYDTYIIAGIAIVVVAIGAFSFVNARRYSK